MNKRILYISVLLIFSILFFGFKPVKNSSNKEVLEDNFTEILPNVYLYKDICNVYILKSGTSALLIDAGSGNVKNHYKDIGIKKVEWVLHTHYHRDQCIGSPAFKKTGAQIAISEFEAPLLNRTEESAPFKIPELFLLNGELPGWGRRMAPFQSTYIDKKLNNGDVLKWKQYTITIISTPGHTQGSLSYLVETGGKTICFTGDLIINGGHIKDMYSMQWVYLGNPGIDASINSLQILKELEPDLLLPSHGDVIEHPLSTIKILETRLNQVKDAFTYKRAGRWNWSQFVQVSKHVVQDGGSTTQIVISEKGEALLFDCGKEFTLERLEDAKAKFGIERVDVIIPSHWHYDHIDGIETIAKNEGAKVWVWEGLSEYIEHPEHFPTTCWTGKRIHVDRILKENEEFKWGAYSFKVYHHPVHTEQQMGLYAKVDGLDFYFIADGTGYSKEGVRSSIHCYNGLSLSSGLLKTAQSFSEANPYICLPAHSNVFAINGEEKEEFTEWASKTTEAIKYLLPPDNPDLAYDPYWASFYPARIHIKPGGKAEISLRLKNYSGKAIAGICRLKCYGDFTFENDVIAYEMKPGETKDFPVIVKSKKAARKGIHIITADIEYDNTVFAEFPQAYMQIDE